MHYVHIVKPQGDTGNARHNDSVCIIHGVPNWHGLSNIGTTKFRGTCEHTQLHWCHYGYRRRRNKYFLNIKYRHQYHDYNYDNYHHLHQSYHLHRHHHHSYHHHHHLHPYHHRHHHHYHYHLRRHQNVIDSAKRPVLRLNYW